MPRTDRYTSVAVALHWVIAILILGQIAGGVFMHNLPNTNPNKFDLYQLHKSFGLSILALTVTRLGWRLTHARPSLPATLPGWQKTVAHLTQWGFYGLLLVVPLVGWAMVSVSPQDIDTRYFGIIGIPHLPGFDNAAENAGDVEELLAEVHEYLAFSMLGLLALHVGAALKHHFVDKDGVFASMAPKRSADWMLMAVFAAPLILGAVLYQAFGSSSAATASTVAASENNLGGNWRLDPEGSYLRFIGSQNGDQFSGAFENFTALIKFNEEAPEDAAVRVTVSTASANTGDDLRDSNLPGRAWFHVDDHPQAVFTADGFEPQGGSKFTTDGVLQIKSYEKPVKLSFALQIDGDRALATGSAEIIRTDFGLGDDPEWLDEEGVALSVRVEFKITANRTN